MPVDEPIPKVYSTVLSRIAEYPKEVINQKRKTKKVLFLIFCHFLAFKKTFYSNKKILRIIFISKISSILFIETNINYLKNFIQREFLDTLN